MKINLLHLLFHTTCKIKNRIMIPLLIFAMVMTSIAVPDEAKAEEDEYVINLFFDFSNICVTDKDGNILFEMFEGQVTQQDTEKVKYTHDDTDYGYVGIIMLTEELNITGCSHLLVTCQSINGNICVSTPNARRDISVISGEKIIISNDEITTETPTTKLRWDKVETAERYVLLLKRRDLGYVVEGGKPFANTKKTSYSVPREKGKTYQIWAQRKVKGKWKIIKTFEIPVSDDTVSVDSRPVSKLRWNKVKKAERYAVLEKRHIEIRQYVGGTPFTYTKTTSCTVRGEEGKTYQIRAQQKVKGKWKTIKTIEITL